MTTDPTSMRLVHTVPGADDVVVERDHTYATAAGPLAFELYRPRGVTGPTPAVVFVSGYPDPGMTSFTGKPLKDWASYQGWARLVAASGLAGVLATNRDPADAFALVDHLRDHAGALGLDPARLAVWACSGHGPSGLAVHARAPVACAALLYPYLLDLDGASEVATASAQFRFARPPLTIDELPRDRPLLVVRAGRDATPGLEASLQRFVAAARDRGLPLTLVDHADAPHAFDLIDDSPRTHAVIDEVVAWLCARLSRPA